MEQSKPKVSVLLSTYNGHKYLKELVDSILSQEDVQVLLQVRDDGSSDDTIDILKSYNDERICITAGTNLKPAKSFLKLLKDCKDSDYYAYCDQDDVWYPNKLKTAISELERFNEPALFISTYDVVNENLEKMFTYDMKFEEELRLQDTLIYRAPSACNMVFNHKLRNIINRSNPEFVRMHDFWTLLVAESHSCKIVTCNQPLIKYRQHEGEAVGITPGLYTRIKRLYKSFVKGDNERWRQCKSLYESYKEDISDEKKEILKLMVNYRKSVSNKFKLITNSNFKTSSFYIDFLFFVAVLFGKF